MNIIIRRAEVSDLETVQKFGSKLLNFEREKYDSSLDEGWAFSDEAEAKYLNAIQNRYVSIAEADGRPVGFLIGNIVTPTIKDARQIKQANLQNIYVDENMRKTGIGKKLIDEFEKYCRGEGVIRLNVSVLAANKAAIDFYYNNGFKPRSFNLSREL